MSMPGRRYMRVLLALFTAVFCNWALADTTVVRDGCVRYRDTGRVYEVRVNIVDGQDLWPKYSWASVVSKYAIVFWDNDEATVIDLGVLGFYMDTGVNGRDLQGREWKVARRPFC
jgi:hypothetical protein